MAESKEIYVVTGESGGHESDFSYWCVRGFTQKVPADLLVAVLNKWCVDNGCFSECPKGLSLEARPPDDPGFNRVPFYGVTYEVVSMPLNDTDFS